MTAREWIEKELDPNVASKAIGSILACSRRAELDTECESLRDALDLFIWAQTIEGFDYWDAVYETGKPPIITTPADKDRELLMEFAEWWSKGNELPKDTVISERAVTDFLNQKYNNNGTN